MGEYWPPPPPAVSAPRLWSLLELDRLPMLLRWRVG